MRFAPDAHQITGRLRGPTEGTFPARTVGVPRHVSDSRVNPNRSEDHPSIGDMGVQEGAPLPRRSALPFPMRARQGTGLGRLPCSTGRLGRSERLPVFYHWLRATGYDHPRNREPPSVALIAEAPDPCSRERAEDGRSRPSQEYPQPPSVGVPLRGGTTREQPSRWPPSTPVPTMSHPLTTVRKRRKGSCCPR